MEGIMEKIILLGTIVFVSVILFISGLLVNKFSNNGIFFGVRIPKEYEKDEDLINLEKEYKKKYMVFILPFLILINILMIFNTKISIYLITLFVLIIVSNIPLVVYWKKTIKLKEEKGFRGLGENVVVVDTSIRKPKVREDNVIIKTRTFLALLIIPLITTIVTLIAYKNVPNPFPIHYNAAGVADSFVAKDGFKGFLYLVLFPILIQTGMIVLLTLTNKFAVNGKTEINSGTLEGIKKQRKVFKRINSIILFIIAIEVLIMFSIIQFCTLFGWNVKVINYVFLPVILLTVMIFSVVTYKIGQGGKNIKYNSNEKEIYRDDDKYWLFGNFYCNKNDPSIFVEKRVGIGWDVNLGNPIGITIMILPFVLIAILIIYFLIQGI